MRRRALESEESEKARRACIDRDGMVCDRCPERGECRHAAEALDDDVEEVWGLWGMCRTQMRYSFGGVAGLDYNAVKVVADAIGYELDGWTLDRLRFLERDMLEEQAERQKAEETKRQGN